MKSNLNNARHSILLYNRTGMAMVAFILVICHRGFLEPWTQPADHWTPVNTLAWLAGMAWLLSMVLMIFTKVVIDQTQLHIYSFSGLFKQSIRFEEITTIKCGQKNRITPRSPAYYPIQICGWKVNARGKKVLFARTILCDKKQSQKFDNFYQKEIRPHLKKK